MDAVYTGRWVTILEGMDARTRSFVRRAVCNTREMAVQMAERWEKLFPEADVEVEPEIIQVA